jgi:broad specificity phosphatase PhoE
VKLHYIRHGEVYNPEGVLYERLPNFHLSKRGVKMAGVVGKYLADNAINAKRLYVSPLERAQETAGEILKYNELQKVTDDRLIEAKNVFAGLPVSARSFSFKDFSKFINPFRPSWGEPYKQIATRMTSVGFDALEQAIKDNVDDVIVVSHQTPIYIARRAFEGKRVAHIPSMRGTTLCSITSFEFDENKKFQGVSYAEPAINV